MNIAPVWKRAIAFALDLLIEISIYSLLIAFLNWILQLPIEYSFFEGRGISVKMTEYVNSHFVELALIYLAAKLAVIVPYFVLAESSRWQATIGKKIFGLKVGDVKGNRIAVGKAGLRLFGKWISGQILLLGYLMAFFTDRKRALHDFIAGTVVYEK